MLMSTQDKDFFDWISQLGNPPISANSNFPDLSSFENDLTQEGSISANLLELHEKYLGSNLYLIEDGNFVADEFSLSCDIVEGSNYFHFISGEFPLDAPNSNFAIALSSSKFYESSATAGSSIDIADVIWQKQGKSIQGAWLKSFDNEFKDETLRTLITRGHNIFRFPFPGRGLSAREIGWVGPQTTNIEQQFLPIEEAERLEREIEEAYWAFGPTLSSSRTLDIHQTTLIDDGALPGATIPESDQIYTRPSAKDSTDDGKYTGEYRTEYLYDFQETQLPISPGDNKIYFPLQRTSQNRNDQTRPSFQMHIDQSGPIPLSAINLPLDMAGSVASLNIETADKIYKLAGFCGAITEVAWLSGCPIQEENCSPYSSAQASFFSTFTPGVETRFVFHMNYVGDIKLNEIFYGLDHDPWCPYLQEDHISYFSNSDRVDPTIDYEQFSQCKCKTVYHSPLGHNRNFEDFWEFSDILYLDPLSGYENLDPLSLNTWRDREGRRWDDSDQFAYYSYSGIEPDVGWGVGEWKTGNGDPFILKQGEVYIYRRSNLNSCGDTPELVINRVIERSVCQDNTKTPIWAKAVIQNDEYVDTGNETDMILDATDFIIFEHQGSYDFTCSAISSFEFATVSTQITSSVELVPISSLGGVGGTLVENTIITETEVPIVSTGTKLLENAITHIAPSFLWTTPLENTRPFWAMTEETYCINKESHLDCIDTYIPMTQPSASDLKLPYDIYFDYQRCSEEPFIWEQPLRFFVNELRDPQWMNLDCIVYSSSTIDKITNRVFPLQDPTLCVNPPNIPFLQFSATNVPSDLVLETRYNCDFLSEVIYCAQNDFTWTGVLTSVDECRFVPPVSSIYAEALTPWHNIQNSSKGCFNSNYPKPDSTKIKNKCELGILTPNRTSKEVLRGGNLTITYRQPEK